MPQDHQGKHAAPSFIDRIIPAHAHELSRPALLQILADLSAVSYRSGFESGRFGRNETAFQQGYDEGFDDGFAEAVRPTAEDDIDDPDEAYRDGLKDGIELGIELAQRRRAA